MDQQTPIVGIGSKFTVGRDTMTVKQIHQDHVTAELKNGTRFSVPFSAIETAITADNLDH
jgi:hypothetical protein